jgi:outer membrane protein assembly factor BamD (BamD/ComL family)/peroxiredoxin
MTSEKRVSDRAVFSRMGVPLAVLGIARPKHGNRVEQFLKALAWAILLAPWALAQDGLFDSRPAALAQDGPFGSRPAALAQDGPFGSRPAALAQDGEVDRILLRFRQRADRATTIQEFRRLLMDTRAELERFLKDHPKHRDAARAAFHVAESYLSDRDFDPALERLDAFLRDHPASEHAPTARFARGEALLEKENDAAARAAFEEFGRLYPDDKRAVIARIYAAVSLQNEKRYDEAAAALGEARRRYKDQKESWNAVMQLALLHHVQEKHADARRTLEELIRECPEREPVEIARRHLTEYLRAGGDAPAFWEKDLAGNPASLEKLRGKPAVLYFFESAGPAAIAETGFLRRAREQLKGDVEILGFSLDLDRRELGGFLEERKVDWPILFDGKGFDGKLARLYDVRGLPHLVVLDRKGKVRFFNVAGRDLRNVLARLLEEK